MNFTHRYICGYFFAPIQNSKKLKKIKKKSKKVLTSIYFSAIIIARKGTETPKNKTAERQEETIMTTEIMMRERFCEEEYDRKGYEIVADGTAVGTIEIIDNFNDDNDVCYVERIDIDEAHRNQGIGTKVLTGVLYEELGYYTAVVAPDNSDAQRLYERIGTGGYSKYDLDYMDQGYGVYSI